MTYKEFVGNWEVRPNHFRRGQWLMLYLFEVWPEEYRRLASIDYYVEDDIDCYYNDDLISNTLKHLEKVWINFPN